MPQKLPHAYRKWIGEAAQVDSRLVLALRNVRDGKFVYGEDNGQAVILQGICKDHNLPMTWGSPEFSVPIPCEVIHAGRGPSCHWHAFSRFLQSFQSSFMMYFPVQILFKIHRLSIKSFWRVFKDAARSSTFLAAFITLFYYSVCIIRGIAGPLLVRLRLATPQTIDNGLCVAAGCLTCGWSILIENPRRRAELAFFVAPRAAATFLPRRYSRAKVCQLNFLPLAFSNDSSTCGRNDSSSLQAWALYSHLPKRIPVGFGAFLG